MNIFNKVNAIGTDIESEVEQQHILAVANLKPDVVARAYVNTQIATMPDMLKQDYELKFFTRDDSSVFIEQQGDLSKALWVIALQLTMSSGNSSYTALTVAFNDWIKVNKVKTADIDTERWARMYFAKMQKLSILRDVKETLNVDIAGKMTEVQGYAIASHIRTKLDDIHAELEERVQMVCKPLDNVPADWISRVSGVGKLANMSLIPKASKVKREIPDSVLDAVNKLQQVAYQCSPVILEDIADALDRGEASDEASFEHILTLPHTPVHFPITMDTRGRMYPRGGISTYQGIDAEKAVFQFAKSRPLGKYGFTAIQIQVANCLGYDKLSMNDRITACMQEVDAGILDVADSGELLAMCKNASRYQAYVAVMELKSAIKWQEDGNDITKFESTLVCHRDGTANGIQHMSAITKHQETAEVVNCTQSLAGTAPTDIYKVISELAVKLVKQDDARMLLLKYGRDITKAPIMIYSYGAGMYTLELTIAEFLRNKGESIDSADVIASVIRLAIDTATPAVKFLFASIQRNVKAYMKQRGIPLPDKSGKYEVYDGTCNISWTTADGFPVDIDYRDDSHLRVDAGNFSAKRSGDTVLLTPKVMSALPPNFVHSIDATHIRMVALACDWELATVHDSIGSHAGTYFDTGRIVREQYIKLHEYDATSNLYAMLGAKNRFKGDYDVTDALNAIYMFS